MIIRLPCIILLSCVAVLPCFADESLQCGVFPATVPPDPNPSAEVLQAAWQQAAFRCLSTGNLDAAHVYEGLAQKCAQDINNCNFNNYTILFPWCGYRPSADLPVFYTEVKDWLTRRRALYEASATCAIRDDAEFSQKLQAASDACHAASTLLLNADDNKAICIAFYGYLSNLTAPNVPSD